MSFGSVRRLRLLPAPFLYVGCNTAVRRIFTLPEASVEALLEDPAEVSIGWVQQFKSEPFQMRPERLREPLRADHDRPSF